MWLLLSVCSFPPCLPLNLCWSDGQAGILKLCLEINTALLGDRGSSGSWKPWDLKHVAFAVSHTFHTSFKLGLENRMAGGLLSSPFVFWMCDFSCGCSQTVGVWLYQGCSWGFLGFVVIGIFKCAAEMLCWQSFFAFHVNCRAVVFVNPDLLSICTSQVFTSGCVSSVRNHWQTRTHRLEFCSHSFQPVFPTKKWKIWGSLNISVRFLSGSFPPGMGTQTETGKFLSQFPNSLFPFLLLVFWEGQNVLYFEILFFEFEKGNWRFSFSVQLV